MTKERIIKKYPNRRLYDTEKGAYITLDDIKELVLDRIEFTVIDVRTKKNITQSTLLQVITEQENSATPLFTTPILQDLIRFYHEKSQHLFSQFFEQALQFYSKQQALIQQSWPTYPWFKQAKTKQTTGSRKEDKS